MKDAPDREYSDDTAREAPLTNRPLVRKEGKPGKTKLPIRKQDGILEELDRLDARFVSILNKPALEWDFGQLEHDYQLLRSEAESNNIQQMIDTRLDKIANYRKTRSTEEDLARIQSETARRDAELAEIQRRQEAQLASSTAARFDGRGNRRAFGPDPPRHSPLCAGDDHGPRPGVPCAGAGSQSRRLDRPRRRSDR